MRVIGTAGHVDHGKSTLIESLTGMNPDRLKEEQERQMTIDLGFAWMELPNGEQVGIVDVPGHRDFIGNMLAGVGGIDAALFVVAADEGVMPQTREHLAILDLLQINGGLVALTKIDLIDDQDWLALVEDDVRSILIGTVLEEAQIVLVSSISGQGLPVLLESLGVVLAESPPRRDLGRPRLPVDRVFSIAGFGTVTTGTLGDGHFRVGEEVEILPSGIRGRIRGLQTHKQKEDIALPGSRTAINISGVALEEIKRGDVVAHVGDYQPTRRMDVRFRLLGDVSHPLKHNTEVKLFVGANEVLARVRTLGSDVLQIGDEGWLQLEMREPVIVRRGDHYILRRPSPGETLGGGTVVDPSPVGRHKRFTSGLIDRLESLAQGTPADIYLQSLSTVLVAPLREVTLRSNLEDEVAQRAIDELVKHGELIPLEFGKGELSANSDILVASSGYWEQISTTTQKIVEEYHSSFPLRGGMPKEELKSRLDIPPRLFSAMVQKKMEENQLEEKGPLILSPGHKIKFSPQQEEATDALLKRFKDSPYSPPSVKEAKMDVGDEVFQAMIDVALLIPVSTEIIFRREDYDRMVVELRHLFQERGTLSAAQVRDYFNTSRRYVLALLEHLDEIGVTVREGDVRRLR
jgi:selenocysteine-specific elongation factor